MQKIVTDLVLLR